MSSIWSSLSGIRAHQFMLDVIGDDLANTNTTGFKSSRVTFSDMMSQTLRPATSASELVGGTNPVQVGLGVQIGGVTRDFSQGRLQDTGNPLDLAMDGNGFMVLSDGSQNVFTRSSSFTVDARNQLVDSVTGYRLLGTDNQAVSIPYDRQIPANMTTSLIVAGNLSTSASIPTAEVLATGAPLEAGGSPATASTDLSSLDSTTTPYADGDTILISGTGEDGSAITPVTFTYGASNDGTTLGDLVTAINTAFNGQATASIDSSGLIKLTSDNGGAASLSLTLANQSGAGVTNWAQHAFTIETVGQDGGTYILSANIYDSRGNAHILTLTFTRMDGSEWNMSAKTDDPQVTLTKANIDGIRFNTDGSFNSVTVGGVGGQQLSLDYGGAASSQTIQLSFGDSGSFDGLTLFGGSSTAAAVKQDGYVAGSLNSFNIGRDGVIQGMYTNGQIRDLAQIRTATFDNPEGLTSLGKGIWGTTPNSGDPAMGTAMSGRTGAIVSSVLEGSNVDSAGELSKLIIAQNGFQLSTRAMAVSNQVLQSLAQVI